MRSWLFILASYEPRGNALSVSPSPSKTAVCISECSPRTLTTAHTTSLAQTPFCWFLYRSLLRLGLKLQAKKVSLAILSCKCALLDWKMDSKYVAAAGRVRAENEWLSCQVCLDQAPLQRTLTSLSHCYCGIVQRSSLREWTPSSCLIAAVVTSGSELSVACIKRQRWLDNKNWGRAL